MARIQRRGYKFSLAESKPDAKGNVLVRLTTGEPGWITAADFRTVPAKEWRHPSARQCHIDAMAENLIEYQEAGGNAGRDRGRKTKRPAAA